MAGVPRIDCATGQLTGLSFPAHPQGLIDAGPAFLTRAMRAWGALSGDNEVTGIAEAVDWPGGSTGRKLALSVTYAHPLPALPDRLFVKFSRDFDDPVRDHGRTQMASEVRFAALARDVELPVTAPATLFADYEDATGTGILITERITFGLNGIEPHRAKCLDDELPDATGHYRALLSAVARLAGADHAGRLPADLMAGFRADGAAASVGERPQVTPHRAQRHVDRYTDFAARYPALLPEQIREPRFLTRLSHEAVRLADHADDVERYLSSRAAFTALCHWNANIDNAWFWRTADGALACGLMDWGCAGRMNVAMAIWGALSGAETDMWDHHFGELLTVFADEFRDAGGPRLDVEELTDHVVLYAAVMGVTWLIGAPAFLSGRLPESVQSRHDPAVRDDEPVRAQLQMLTTVLNLWRSHDVGAALDRCLLSMTPPETPIV